MKLLLALVLQLMVVGGGGLSSMGLVDVSWMMCLGSTGWITHILSPSCLRLDPRHCLKCLFMSTDMICKLSLGVNGEHNPLYSHSVEKVNGV